MIKLHRPYIYPNLVFTIGPLDIEYHRVIGPKVLILWRGRIIWETR